MFTNEKLRLYLFLFLAFSVSSSKNLLIYNEETLVALSFFCFLFFVLHYFGNTIRDSLNERSGVIREELQNFLLIKENSHRELLHQHQKTSGLMKALTTLHTFTTGELGQLNVNGDKALKNLFRSRIEAKFKTLGFSKLMIQQRLQSLLSEKIMWTVLVSFSKRGKGTDTLVTYRNQAIKQAVSSLVSQAQ